MSKSFIEWMVTETPTRFSVDFCSVEVNEKALEMGFDTAAGNPRMTYLSICAMREKFEKDIQECKSMSGDAKAYELYRRYVTPCAKVMQPLWEKSGGTRGYQCAMVNPKSACSADQMIEDGLLLNSFAPNITVKLPTTGAGIEAAEELAALGVHVTGTVGFSVAQCLLLAEAHARGRKRAIKNGIKPKGANFALFGLRVNGVIDEIAKDNQLSYIGPEETKWVAVAVAKRLYKVLDDKGFIDENDFWLVPAGISEGFLVKQFTGGKVLIDLNWPHVLVVDEELKDEPREYHIDDPVALDRLMGVKGFRELYEYDGLSKNDLISWGPIQNVITNFGEAGFQKMIEL